MKKVHLINHTHWDREWYFSTMDSLVLSDEVFLDVLQELKNHPEAKFVLDGQISIVKEFLSIRPEWKGDIQELVNRGQLFLGPWYTQSDAQLVGGISILRNLMVGIYEAQKISSVLYVGYLPDTFGFNSQMPTIYNHCGIDSAIFWRGIDYTKIKSPYFQWKGLGSSKVYAVNLIDGYGSIPQLFTDDDFLKNKIFAQEQKLRAKTDLEEVLIPIGNDQNTISHDFTKKLKEINKKSESEYISSTLDDFINYLREQKDSLEIYEGEFRTPTTGRVHKTIGSVRMDLKLLNEKTEEKIVRRIEPLMVLAQQIGVSISKELLIAAWEKVMEGQAHDGMAGCVTDSVAQDIRHRYKQANEICDGIENRIKNQIAKRLGLSEDEVLLFNVTGKELKQSQIIRIFSKYDSISIPEVSQIEVLECIKHPARNNIMVEGKNRNYFVDEPAYYEYEVEVKTEMPKFGYRVIHIQEGDSVRIKKSDIQKIQNDKYIIEVIDGKLHLQVGNKTIKDWLIFEDCGNDGDTYDFSPLRNDSPLYFSDVEVAKVCIGSMRQIMDVEMKMTLPEKLENRIKGSNLNVIKIQIRIVLREGDSDPEIQVQLNNTVESHRLRLGIKTDICTDHSIASTAFGFIKRPVLKEVPKNWESRYSEIPVDLEVMEENVSLTDNRNICTVYSKGVKEYQIVEDRIYLTLLATTGELGKADLLYRPGRASGDTTKKGHIPLSVPEAQLLGVYEYDFKVSYSESNFDAEQIIHASDTFHQQDIYYQLQHFNEFICRLDSKLLVNYPKDLKNKCDLLDLEGLDVFSIVPSLYDSDSFLIQIKNLTKQKKDVNLSRLKSTYKVSVVDANENVKELTNSIGPYELLTIKLTNR
ncbi:MAG: glycoside hydrolase family 38 C-terminal domain-containing protein [Faecalicoccus sp.]|uniref:glycoside hydrolase family 38 N-terminal domain-containing protein n=1 Tax=unclassified Faecalicoccus TaxID=2643311 RepID=UPI0025FFD68A|nr:glycoside hydrolase family 38 C-terminal domain-containing protein [Faecalicoccus sp.]MCI6379274.1 hypothetical protein [Erysipelotrichaceae bacterium]MDY4868806.1 glycoside hydrolase family 38 C-terminal domain-containing protein [Faecalicoccus sp.]